MSNIFPFNVVNDLSEDSFIAGSYKVITFTFTDSNGDAVDLSTFLSLNWVMARYGSSIAVLSKEASYTGTPINKMTITLSSSDTSSLSGKYIHQPILTDAYSNIHKPSQGILTISSGIIGA